MAKQLDQAGIEFGLGEVGMKARLRELIAQQLGHRLVELEGRWFGLGRLHQRQLGARSNAELRAGRQGLHQIAEGTRLQRHRALGRHEVEQAIAQR